MGISLMEVLTAIAILAVGIWAVVTLFPRGQDIIRRSGLRQQATQLAHEAISDFLAEPAKLPFAIVPFDPTDPQIVNRPVLLEPADLLTVRRTFNFVWGEPLDDGLPQGDPNKRVGLVWVDINGNNQPDPQPSGVDQWRALLRFVPAAIFRVYRKVRYTPVNNQNALQNNDFVFYFDPTQPNTLYLPAPVTRPSNERVLRVTYRPTNNPSLPVVRELYLADVSSGQVTLRTGAGGILEVTEEFPLVPNPNPNNPLPVNEFRFLPEGVLIFGDPTPRPPNLSPNDPRLKELGVDYFVADPNNPQLGDHWVVETGATFDPDPMLKQQQPQISSVFQTTFGGFNYLPNNLPSVQVLSLMPPPQWGNPIDNQNGLLIVDAQNGLLAFNLPVGTRMRVAYRAGDNPATPVDESWFVQVIKPPDDFQLLTQADPQVLAAFPFEQLRWFILSGQTTLRFNPLLAGLNIQVRYRNAANELVAEVRPIGGDGSINLSQVPTRIEGASLLVRVSGGSMWRQSPPKNRADYVELATIIPPPAKATTP
jgi:hypothetical protein